MSENADQQPKKKKFTSDIRDLGQGRYRAQRGTVIVTFLLDEEFRMTLVDAPKSFDIKQYKFLASDPIMVLKVASVIKDAARHALKLKKEAEAGNAEDSPKS